jgi:hypothetical protein
LFQEFRVNILHAYTSAIAAMGIACSSSAFAGTVFVHAAYVPPVVVYAPPRTLYYVPSQPRYVVPVVPYVPAPVVVRTAAPALPLPYATIPVPVRSITYAQPVAAVPTIVVR